MAQNDNFISPHDASSSLIVDIAGQIGTSHERGDGADRLPRLDKDIVANDNFISPHDASPSLIADIAGQIGTSHERGDGAGRLPRLDKDIVAREHGNEVRRPPQAYDNNADSNQVMSMNRSTLKIGDCQSSECISEMQRFLELYKEKDEESIDAQQMITSILDSNTDNELANGLYSQLIEDLTNFKTLKSFEGHLNTVIENILDFFDVLTRTSLRFSRHAADTRLVDSITMLLTSFKVQHFLNTLDEKIQRFLYLGLKLICQLLMHQDETIERCIKNKMPINILRLYVSSPDPQYQLLALTAVANLKMENNEQFVVNPSALKLLMETACKNNSRDKTAHLAIALEKLMKDKENLDMLLEMNIISNLKTMLETDEVSVMLRTVRLLSCLSKDTSLVTRLHDQFSLVLSSKSVSFPQPEVKTALSELIVWLVERSKNQRSARHRDAIKGGRHVMISYSHKDKVKVDKIYTFLKSHKIEVWIDQRSAKTNLDDMMASAVENSAIFICCISESYKLSVNTKKEFGHAVRMNKPIIPVRLDDCELNGWLGINLDRCFIHDLREISDAGLFDLLNNISRTRSNSLDGEMMTLRLDDLGN